eukprot:TRINITY_DN7452_c0_g1_i7.p1 TRINITY_DN7452_c0_g1~~TRINITY_DN7452_c0_g1_i7.p1  ORF type:complete len:611 (-),score=110.06 TRINITY_DN7452_c0_g1_i7:1063-2895(-)
MIAQRFGVNWLLRPTKWSILNQFQSVQLCRRGYPTISRLEQKQIISQAITDSHQQVIKEEEGGKDDEGIEGIEGLDALEKQYLQQSLTEFDHSNDEDAQEGAEQVIHMEDLTEGEAYRLRKGKQNFADIGIDPRFSGRLPKMGVMYPSPVQAEVIPAILKGESMAIQSYTGSGKTLAYLLPVMTKVMKKVEAAIERSEAAKKIDPELGEIQAVIVSPSRELSMQIHQLAKSLLPNLAQTAVQQLIGGANFKRQTVNMKKNRPMMIVGTPGRVVEHSRFGTLKTHNCPILVLDEADQMFLNPNFRDCVLRIMEHVGKKVEKRQIILVSATMTKKFVTKMEEYVPGIKPFFVKPPEEADKKSKGPAATFLPPNLVHASVMCSKTHLVDGIRRVIHAIGAQKALVFMNYTRRLKDTLFKLLTRGMPVAILHGEQSKSTRQKVMDEFRRGEYRALIVSDVLARGMDIPDCDLVINMELPSDATHYAHRAGRTGRMGRRGIVVSMCGPKEAFIVRNISDKLKIDIKIALVQQGRFLLKEDGTQVKAEGSKYAKASKWDEGENRLFQEIGNLGDEDGDLGEDVDGESKLGEDDEELDGEEDVEFDDNELERDMGIL